MSHDRGLLEALAELSGVSVSFGDWLGRHTVVADETIVAVLGALGVDATTPERAAQALTDARERRWRTTVPPTVVQFAGERADVAVHCRHGDAVDVHVETEAGDIRTDVEQLMVWVDPVEVEGALVGEATYRLPADLPPGYHRLVVRTGGRRTEATLVVAPARALASADAGRRWGLAVQLYAARSTASWGMGDLGDLATILRWVGARGGDAVLVNPLHAAAPVTPVEPSPYYPVTRRFRSPLYLRIADLPEYAAVGWATRARIDGLRPDAGDRIDRDAVWRAKSEALTLLWAVAQGNAVRRQEIAEFREREGVGLERFAVWCVLAERYALPWQNWPAELHDPTGPAVADVVREREERVAFHCWVQMLCDEQLARAQSDARAAGMSLGVIHDLAVGVDPGGADTWSLRAELARGVTVGAPPDQFNQQGQDWQQPPWRPDALAAEGYAAYRDMLRAALRHAGGLRVDHVLGLFRLWWIPEGAPPTAGTYVHYDADAMLGVLLLEAERANAVVIGEDLGTVAPGVRDVLARRGVLGSTVLWFEMRPDGLPVPPEEWRELSAATVTTHDMASAAGLLRLAHVDLRERLGLLDRPVEEERAAEQRTRDGWLELAADRGLLAPGDGVDGEVRALHALLAASPCRLVLGSLADIALDPRQPNQPGTVGDYPNWCLPLARQAGGDVEPVLLDDVLASDTASAIVAALGARQPPPVPGST